MMKHTGKILLFVVCVAGLLYYKMFWPSYKGAQFLIKLNLTWNRMNAIAGEIDKSTIPVYSLSSLSVVKKNPEIMQDPFTGETFRLFRSKSNPLRWILVSAGPDKIYNTNSYTTNSITRFNKEMEWHSKGDIIFSNDYISDLQLSYIEIEKIERIRGGRWKEGSDGLYRQK